MKLDISRRTLGIALVVITLLIVLIVFLVFRSRSKYVWPEASSAAAVSTSAYTTYVTGITNCNQVYSAAMIAAGTDATQQSAAGTAKTTCIEGITRTYLKSRCLAVDTDPNVQNDTTLSKAYGENYTKVKSAFTTDITNIRSAFLNIFSNPPTSGWPVALSSSTVNVEPNDTTPTDFTQYVIKKARDAAIAGATRKYIASLCPEYFKTNDKGDSTNAFKAWTYPAVSTDATGALKPQVTAQQVIDWAKRAGWKKVAADGSVSEEPLYKWPGNISITPSYTAGGAKDIDYGKTGMGATTPTYKNYEVARYNGPGSTIATGTTDAVSVAYV